MIRPITIEYTNDIGVVALGCQAARGSATIKEN